MSDRFQPSMLQTLYYGDLNLLTGTPETGVGDFWLQGRITSLSAESCVGVNTGSIVTVGGIGVGENLFVGNALTTIGTTTLNKTTIHTDNGTLDVTGVNGMLATVDGNIRLKSTTGTVTLETLNAPCTITSSFASATAVNVVSTAPSGGVIVQSGSTGRVALYSGTQGLIGTSTDGLISFTSTSGPMNLTVVGSSAARTLGLTVDGIGASQLLCSSSGTGADASSAIRLTSTNTAGSIYIDNAGGTGTGTISLLTGSGGSLVQTAGGHLRLYAVDNKFTLRSTSTTTPFTSIVGVYGATTNTLRLLSEGTASAIEVSATALTGNISLTTATGGTGKVIVASSGLQSTISGNTTLTTDGGVCSIVNHTTLANNNINISVLNSTNSSLNLLSEGTSSTGAIKIAATNGGIDVTSAGRISMQTPSSSGIMIGTTSSVPILIGAPGNTTTFYGDVNILGLTTTVKSTNVTIDDNIIQLNNGPSGTANAGIAMKRYQTANNTNLGDVITDVAVNNNNGTFRTAQGGTSTTIILNSADSAVDGTYNGYWIRIISGTGSGQVRRIKSYLQSSNTATIYTTADQTDPAVLNSVVPVEGMNFTTTPSSSSVYGLYNNGWVCTIWDTQRNEVANVFSPFPDRLLSQNPTYANTHCGTIVAKEAIVSKINGGNADYATTVSLNDNSAGVVPVSGMPTSGVFFVLVQPVTATGTRPNAIFACTKVSPTSTSDVPRISGGSIYVGLLSGNANLRMTWPSNTGPMLGYDKAIGSGTTDYIVKIIGT